MPDELEPVAQSVLREAVRNAIKHAEPDCIEVRVAATATRRSCSRSLNDGVRAEPRPRPAGMGLRLAAFEALEQGGVVEFGPRRRRTAGACG